MQAGVDHLEPMVPQRPRDGLRPAVVTIETWLGNHDAIRALHRTTNHTTSPLVGSNRFGPAHCGCATTPAAYSACSSGGTGGRRHRLLRGVGIGVVGHR